MTNAQYLQSLIAEQEILRANITVLYTLGDSITTHKALVYYWKLTDFSNRLEWEIAEGKIDKELSVQQYFIQTA